MAVGTHAARGVANKAAGFNEERVRPPSRVARTLAEQLALDRAAIDHPDTATIVLQCYEHLLDDIWIVQVKTEGHSGSKIFYYGVDASETVRNLFPHW